MTPLLRPKRQVSTVLRNVTRALLAAAVFLTPLFFIPGLNDALELPKATLLTLLTLAAVATQESNPTAPKNFDMEDLSTRVRPLRS